MTLVSLYQVWFDNRGWIASVAYLNAINNVILRSSLPPEATTDASYYGITVINHPMNRTISQKEDTIIIDVGISVVSSMGVIFAMSFVPASIAIFLVEECHSKAKHLQLVSGVKPITFWLSTYIWDMVRLQQCWGILFFSHFHPTEPQQMNFIVPAFLMIIIFVAFDVQTYISQQSLPGLILLFLFYG